MNSVDASRGRRRRAPAVRLFSAFALVLAALSLMGFAKPRKPRPMPRSPLQVMEFMSGGPHDADCRDCHTTHASDLLSANDHALVGPNDNTLCMTCHESAAWEGGSWAGLPLYEGSAHGSGLSMVWPGPYPPARTDVDAAGKCLNCHGPHGWEDGDGKIPHLANAREEALCLTCHDGAHADSDVRSDFLKPYTHPTSQYRGRHTGPDETTAESFGISPINRRHAECADCHNPHVARHEEGLPIFGEASKRLLGVSRVLVTNGAAGSTPAYTFLAASDTSTAPVAEYQLCFKCHSSWTRQPSGQTDLGRVLNPANPSFHPVEDVGRNVNIDPTSFVGGWSAASKLRCGDCHASDSGESNGPHGSSYEHILRAPYQASETPRVMEQDELCFSCHSFDVYANPAAPELVRRASRFNQGAGTVAGHAEHVGTHRVSCFGCHTTHGSTDQKHLIALGRTPGITSYTETMNGGSCVAFCHTSGLVNYTVNYAR